MNEQDWLDHQANNEFDLLREMGYKTREQKERDIRNQNAIIAQELKRECHPYSRF